MAKVKISPVSFLRGKPDAEYLNVIISSDDLSSRCSLTYQLFGVNKSVDTKKVDANKQPIMKEINGDVIAVGSLVITGDDYKNWDGNNDFPAEYVAKELSLTIIS